MPPTILDQYEETREHLKRMNLLILSKMIIFITFEPFSFIFLIFMLLMLKLVLLSPMIKVGDLTTPLVQVYELEVIIMLLVFQVNLFGLV